MPDLLEKKIGGREKIEEGGEEMRGREKMKGRESGYLQSRSRRWECRFYKIRNRRWECRLLNFFKIQKLALGVPVIEIFYKTETAVGNAGY